MSGKRNKSSFEHAGYYLCEPNAKYPTYGVGWFDAGAEQSRRKSLGTTDPTEAQLKLVLYATQHPLTQKREVDVGRVGALLATAKPLDAQAVGELDAMAAELKSGRRDVVAANDLPLMSCMVHYYAMRKDDLGNPERVECAMRNAMEVWGNVMCSELLGPKQHAFIAELRARKDPVSGLRCLADSTILNRLVCIWTCMNFCVAHGLIKKEAVPARLHADMWAPPAKITHRTSKLTLEQLVKLFEVAASRERWWRWLIIEVGTAARPAAPFELTPAELDEVGNLKLLPEFDENGELNVQSKKVKATIRCAPTLLSWLKHWGEEVAKRPRWMDRYYIVYHGRKMITPKFFPVMCREAGIKVPKRIGAYVLRHTILSWLANNGCPSDQRKIFGGHELDRGPSADYVHFDPTYLQEAAQIIERLYVQIDEGLKSRRLLVPNNGPSGAVLKELRPVELEEQPVARYASWFWGELQVRGWRFTREALHDRGIKRGGPGSNQEVTTVAPNSDKVE